MIELSGVGVRFQIAAEKISSFKEYVLRLIMGGANVQRDLWALRNVDLRVSPGELFGIVGRNGAGKSTLLKVLARLLAPTEGRVILRGRTVPLLELAAGFHQDLSGEENVYIFASLLGHDRADTTRLFDEIVDFAELRAFLHMPVRQYSGGMLARLGFAVVTMTRPDILLVDEVLAVGDAPFQEKCLERIREFRELGTTVVLVSHTEPAIRLCDRALFLRQGRVEACGPPDLILRRYSAAFPVTVEVGEIAVDDGETEAADGEIAADDEEAAADDLETAAADGEAVAADSVATDRQASDREAGDGVAAGEVLPAAPAASELDDDELVDLLRQRAGDDASVYSAFRLFAELRHIASRHRFDLERVLELGPGGLPGSLLCFLAAGSARAATTGQRPLQPMDDRYFQQIKDYLTLAGGFGWWRRGADLYAGRDLLSPVCWNEVDVLRLARRIELLGPETRDLTALETGAFSFIFSIDSLEHHEDPEQTIRELRRVLEPGGGTVHEIPLAHPGTADPLDLLRHTEEEYLALRRRGSSFSRSQIPLEVPLEHAYCNRWRTSDYVRAFEQAGFEIRDVEPVIVMREERVDRSRFAEPFRSKDPADLAIIVVRLTAVALD